MSRRLPFLLLPLLLLTACTSRPAVSVSVTEGDTLVLRHARYFQVVEHGDSLDVTILSPWQPGTTLQHLVVTQPLSHAAVFTSTHAALLAELGCVDAIAGICEPQYVSDSTLRKALADGRLHDLGSAMTPNRELLAEVAPDALLLSPFENVGTYGNLEQLGIRMVWCADYMEPTALGRAEWMRLYGRLFGCGDRADSLFAAVERRYRQTAEVAMQSDVHPTVIFDTPIGSTWHMPGGASTLGQMVADAGGRYLFADGGLGGSVPYSFEQVYARGRDADVWLVRYSAPTPLTHSGLSAQHPSFRDFRALQTGRVYGCNNSDLVFFERYPFHPDLLLADFSAILQESPQPLHFFHPLQP